MKTYSIAALLSLILVTATTAANWPGWRGDGSGVSTETNLPVHWSSESNILWKARIDGYGVSSPVVWGDKIFLTSATTGLQGLPGSRVAVALGLLAVLLSLVAVWRSSRSETLSWVDRFIAIACLAAFAFGLLRLFVIPDGIERQADLLAWRWSGGMFCASLAAAIGLQSVTLIRRLIGSVLLLMGATAFLLLGPERQVGRTEVLAAMAFSLLALWFLGSWVRSRFSSRPHAARLERWSLVATTMLLTAAAWQLYAANVLYSRADYRRTVMCLDRDTGSLLWRRILFTTPRLKTFPRNSYATPTPACDGNHVVVDFGVGLAGLDMKGHVLWKHARPNYARYLIFGFAPSPIMADGLVIQAYFPEALTAGKIEGSADLARLTAYEPGTGKIVWEHILPGGHDCYNSPALLEYQSRPAVTIATWGYLLIYNRTTGEPLLVHDSATSECVPTPLWDGSLLYFSVGENRRSEGLQAVKFVSEYDSVFRKTLAPRLWRTDSPVRPGRAAPGAACGCGPDRNVRPPEERPEARLNTDQGHVQVRWRNKLRPSVVSSPVLYQGLLYIVSEKGIAVCVEPEFGHEIWRKDLDGEYYASLIAGDGMVYFTSVDGVTTVIRTGREGEVLARNDLGVQALASPAISTGRIFLRGRKTLHCIGVSQKHPL